MPLVHGSDATPPMTEAEPLQRVFFALWPDDDLRAALAALARSMPANGRPVPAAHLHLTLAFPGTVTAARVAEMATRADALRAPAVHLVLARLGWFSRPRVAWIGPVQVVPELEDLAADLRGVCRAAGVTIEDRAFRPHVTLRRFVTRLESHDIEPLEWRPTQMVLIESGQGGHPGSYRVLRSWPVPG
jgi:RNA 2',3'-cyclic 3'-phosphodiesterase